MTGDNTVGAGPGTPPQGWPRPARAATRDPPSGFRPAETGNPESMSYSRGKGSSTAARVIAVVADIMAFIIGLWILMYLLDANRSNDLVDFVQHSARWLAGWSYDLFTFDAAWARVVAGYGLAAVVYLFVGHAVAGRIRH